MSLQFYFGGAGSEKSDLMYRQLIEESIASPERSFIVLVPEQFTLQTQRHLVSMHPSGGILNIDVLSFDRLAKQVLAETGYGHARVLTETGKNLILRRVAGSVKDDLTVLGGRMDQQGYIESVKSVLSEFAQYEVTQDDLRDMIESAAGKPLLSRKLEDLFTLHQAFTDFRQEKKMLVGEELLQVFAEAAGRSAKLKNSVIVMDEFTGFTPVQMTALRAMLHAADTIRIALVLGDGVPWEGALHEEDLYYLSRRTVQAVYRLCKQEHVQILPCIRVPEKNAPLRIQVTAAKDPGAEAEDAAAQIFRMIAEKHMHPRDIAVVAADLTTYEHHLTRAFSSLHIPYFIDHKVPARLNPALELIRSLFEAVEYNFAYEPMMRLLRTGYVLPEREAVDLVDRYLLAAGIRGRKQWFSPWERITRQTDEQQLVHLNELREQIIFVLADAVEVIGKSRADVRDYTEALEAFLKKTDVQRRLAKESGRFADLTHVPMLLSASERSVRAMEYEQIYDEIMKVISEVKILLGGEQVARREFLRILEAGFSEAKIGVIPATTDQVYVGDMERSRLGHPAVLWLMGVNDGLIPARREKKGILSESDRSFLEERHFELAPGMRRDMYTQRFYLHLAQHRPSEGICYSYALSDSFGHPLRASYLISELKEKNQELQIRMVPSDPPRSVTLDTALPVLAESLREDAQKGSLAPGTRQLLAAFHAAGGYEKEMDKLRGAALDVLQRKPILSTTAHALYSDILRGSVSRLDSFALCPYAHFLQYGLLLREREELTVRAADIGTLLHDALRRFFEQVRDDGTWKTIDEQGQDVLAEKCLAESASAFGNGLFDDSTRNRYTYSRAEAILKTTLHTLMVQLQAGSFAPDQLELKFDADLRLRLTGQIDRIDTAWEGNTCYVKIIDYKSGKTKFDLGSIYDGRTLQLPVYLMQAVRQMQQQYPEAEIVPAGLYYCHLDDPLISAAASALERDRENTGNQAAKEILRRLKPDGLTNPDPAVLSLFAPDEALRAAVIPVPKFDSKTGEIKENSPTANREQFAALERFAERRMEGYAQRIMNGDIALLPYADKACLACEYCCYAPVCGYEIRRPDAVCRKRNDHSRGELWKLILEEA